MIEQTALVSCVGQIRTRIVIPFSVNQQKMFLHPPTLVRVTYWGG